jgi:two-component system, sensor histidine kinase
MSSDQIYFEVVRVEQMMETLSRLAGGETDARMAISGKRDHLDALAFGVNAIAQELVFLKEQAEAANAAKSQFLAMMSHEIRTPLSVVLGVCELLRIKEMSPEEIEKNLDRIDTNGILLRSIVDNVLDLSKVESGKLEMTPLQFSPQDALLEVINGLELAASKKGLELRCQIAPDIPASIEVDPTRFRQVLTNLIANSIKFTNHGFVKVAMSFGRVDDSPLETEQLQILVTDSGVGISLDQQKNLFQAFHQAAPETSRVFGGTGLGLMLARQFIRLMNGEVSLVTSELGKGSQFLIRLPVINAKTVRPLLPKAQRVPRKKRLSSVRILIGEDCPDLQMLYQDLLETEGAQVTVAGNGHEVIQQWQKQDFQLLLMDVNMPILNGIDATRKLRAQGCAIPIIALTAEIFGKRLEDCHQAGCTMTVHKPFYSEDLILTLLKLLNPTHSGPSLEQL